MNVEDKILSMLDLIASDLRDLKETMVTKEELRDFKEQLFSSDPMEQNMVTEEQFQAVVEEIQAAHACTISKVNEQIELLEARCNVLNDRLFDQETQLSILKRKQAL